MTPLILKRGPIGWNQDDFDVLENGAASLPWRRPFDDRF